MLDNLNSFLPTGWRLTCLTCLDPEWQAIATDDEHVALATGESIEMALENTAAKIQSYEFVGRLFSLGRMYREPTKPKLNPQALLQSLGLAKSQPFTRRV